MTPSDMFSQLMAQGSALHEAGQPAKALTIFRRALELDPCHAQAASACATMLTELGQPQAAFDILHAVRDVLWRDADGATNYAIAAESCGCLDDARDAYVRALEIDPRHLRALNNTALLAAQAGDWDQAIERLTTCQTLASANPAIWLNLADIQLAARRFQQALLTLQDAAQRFGPDTTIAVRQAIALAFDGQIEAAQAQIDALDAEGQGLLVVMVAGANRSEDRLNRKRLDTHPDAYELFCRQAFEAMQVCDWRDHDRLTAVLRALLEQVARTGQGRDWRDAQLCGLMLPLQEDEMAQLRRVSIDTIGKRLTTPMSGFIASRDVRSDGCIHVGLAIQSLRDPRVANGLQRQLALHDPSRFAIHVYSPAPQIDPVVLREISNHCFAVTDISSMHDDEVVSRMRRDGLDVFVDMAFNSPWCRPEIPERRVAPVQIRQLTWHRHHPAKPCDYNISDTFVHPHDINMAPFGAVVRLPVTCWLSANHDLPDASAQDRAAVGLPADALVLSAQLPALMIDPQSFGLWMKMLLALPDAVLWLPPYAVAARHNLAAAAKDAGVHVSRLVFQTRGTRSQLLARLPLADLMIDTVRFNANQGLVDALRMGLPAVTCAGNNMASRLGGSILRAANLEQAICDSPSIYLQRVIELGRDRSALQELRTALAKSGVQSPLFDTPTRVREWESAWTTMVQRHRDGLAPAAFDVPLATLLPTGESESARA